MRNKKIFTTIINSYYFDKKYSENKIIEVCGIMNLILLAIHPTCKIRIRYERAQRKMSMVMVHTKNVAYDRPIQYKNAMKLFDIAIIAITKRVRCEVIDVAS